MCTHRPQSFSLSDWSTLRPSAICQLRFRFSYPGTGSHGGVCLCVSVLVNCYSLYWPIGLSSFKDSSLLCDITPLMNLRGIVDASVC